MLTYRLTFLRRITLLLSALVLLRALHGCAPAHEPLKENTLAVH